jgi:hypothetical protein
MALAIENHVAVHRKAAVNCVEAELEADRIRALLNTQVLQKASDA